MPLSSVQVSEDVWLTCLAHSLTTETEEIMGLLFGDIQDYNGGKTALIWGASPQMRSDRRKDRVETNPEQLAAATAQAEKLSQTIGRTTRVIGWYHSHPHITVLPSHVDVRTQAMYQMLDRGFIGLIFSCFSEDTQKIGRIQAIAFQSTDSKQRYESPAREETVDIETSSSWSSFDNSRSPSESLVIESIEQDSGDSRMTKTAKIGKRYSDVEQFCTHSDIKYLEKQKMEESSIVLFNAENLHENPSNMNSIDMTESVQEALHRSSIEMSGAEYIRTEVPLIVLPTRALLRLDDSLSWFSDMQHMLFEEEQSAYKQALQQIKRDGKVHPLAYIHHTSTYQASLCKLVEYCLSPAVKMLQDRLKENEYRLGILLEECTSLERDLKLESSPRRSHGGPFPLQREIRSSGDSSGSRSPSGINSRRKTP